ncbi:MAG TPA: hypothetical protein VK151_02895 [Fluviicola sp.]|nr:hypothetical protein [Fluviicola sp.]
MASKHTISGRIIAILGLVVAILSLLVSMIPCIGYYALVPGVVALICCIMGIIYLKKAGKAASIAIVGVLLSALAVASSVYQYIEFRAVFDAKERLENSVDDMEREVKKKVKEEVIDYTTEKIKDYLEDDDTLKKKPAKKSK